MDGVDGALALRPVAREAVTQADRALEPAPDTALWADLDRALRSIRQELDRRLQEAVGLLASDFDLLIAVEEAGSSERVGPGAATMGRLARAVVRSPSGVTRAVTRLAAEGLVDVDARRLTTAGPDRRLSYVRLTALGRERLAAARPVVEAEVTRLFGRHLDPATAAAIQTVAARL